MITTWRFSEIGAPPNHPFIDGIFPYKPSSYWVPYGQPDFSHPSADLWGPIPRHNRDGPGGSNTTPPIWEWFILPIYGDLGDGLLLFYTH